MSGKIRHLGFITYTRPIARAVLRDTRLTFGARGLFAYLCDLPEGWVIRRKHLATMGPEGLDAISSRLKELMRVGAMFIEPIREDEDGNPIPGGRIAGKRWVLVAPEQWAIESPLAREPSPDATSTEDGKTPLSVLPTVGKSAAKGLQGVKGLQAEAAPRAPARGSADAATTTQIGKRRIKRDSGIVTWDAEDIRQAERLEQKHSADHIHAAVTALTDDGKEPVPGVVTRQIDRQQRRQEADQRRANAEAAYQARLKSQPTASDLAAIGRGRNLLPENLRAHVKQKLENKDAQA